MADPAGIVTIYDFYGKIAKINKFSGCSYLFLQTVETLGTETEMALYSLCYPTLSKDDDEFIRSYRREHDLPFRDVVNHHFTLVFGIRDLDKDTYTCHIRDITASYSPISFVCRYAMPGHDALDNNYYVFLVPDEGYSAISLLHDRLYTGPFAPFHRLDIPYIPHISIATIADAPRVKRLCDKLNATGINISGTLNHITVCEYDGNRITDLERIGFGV